MVIHQLVYVSKESGCLWMKTFKYGVLSIKWDQACVEDPQWGLKGGKNVPAGHHEVRAVWGGD